RPHLARQGGHGPLPLTRQGRLGQLLGQLPAVKLAERKRHQLARQSMLALGPRAADHPAADVAAELDLELPREAADRATGHGPSPREGPVSVPLPGSPVVQSRGDTPPPWMGSRRPRRYARAAPRAGPRADDLAAIRVEWRVL